jgi:hypothetical protein
MTHKQIAVVDGEPVTIIPKRGPGESRDTEAGLQPWTAWVVGVLTDGRLLVRTTPPSEATSKTRIINLPLQRRPNGALQAGSW